MKSIKEQHTFQDGLIWKLYLYMSQPDNQVGVNKNFNAGIKLDHCHNFNYQVRT